MSSLTLKFTCDCGHVEVNRTSILDGQRDDTIKEFTGPDAKCDKCHQEAIKDWKFDANGRRIH